MSGWIFESGGFPDWTRITPEAADAALPGFLAWAEAGLAAVEASEPGSYAALVERLDDAARPLRRCWGCVAHLLSVMNSPAWREVEEKWRPKIVEASLKIGQSRPVYEAAKRLARTEADPVRRRILSRMALDAELSGVALDGEKRERYNAIQARLSSLAAAFRDAVIDATKSFSYEKDGKKYTIDDAAYPETMKRCEDREVREALCRARSTRAPENAARIAEILSLRAEAAALLGYPSYAAYSIASKSAPSPEAVAKTIAELDRATAELAAKEDAELAASGAARAIGRIMPWDRAYCAERLREEKYSYSEDELKRHFGLEETVAGLFRLTKFLFGVEIEELKGADRPPVWHGDVRFFAVKENGETVAHFYFDPYVRTGLKSGGAWMNDFATLRKRGGATVERPLALIVANFPEPDADGRCLLPMREVETLFHEFGHALQAMLTRIGEEPASGLGLVEWDAVEVASQFMENWTLDARTGIEVPAELKAKVKAARNFRAASQCRRQLAFADTDLALHSGPVADADAVKREKFAHYGLDAVEGDLFLCSFSHIFAGGYAAGYYGYKWSEVMSADCYGAFEEAGLEDGEAVRRVGAAYRGTVLALGGSLPALETFRRFRGREPRIDALLRQTMGLPPP